MITLPLLNRTLKLFSTLSKHFLFPRYSTSRTFIFSISIPKILKNLNQLFPQIYYLISSFRSRTTPSNSNFHFPFPSLRFIPKFSASIERAEAASIDTSGVGCEFEMAATGNRALEQKRGEGGGC